ncbi:MAG: hypothetical protein ACRD03_01065 [Acidimicrobiales bacterium]
MNHQEVVETLGEARRLLSSVEESMEDENPPNGGELLFDELDALIVQVGP